jgi:peptidoglycan/LPS O-acetylase OafA/YrhL
MTLTTEPLVSKGSAKSVYPLRHIRELDGARGLAALMVFLHHICFTSIIPEGWNPAIRLLWSVGSVGESGVDLFFVLSGFLITSILVDARKSPDYYHDFYWKRALRILPLYALCLLGVLLFVPGSRTYVVLSALFISNFAWLFHIEAVGPFWTLAIEEQFYLLWPTVVRRRSVAQLQRWALCIGASAIVLRFVAAIFGHFNYRLTFFRCDGLAFGALLACWYARRDLADANSTSHNRAIALSFALGVALCLVPPFPIEQLHSLAFFAAFRQTGITLLCGSIIAYLISHTGDRSLAWLRSPLLTFFGLISYAMYMTHIYVLLLYDHLRGELRTGDTLGYTIRFAAVLTATILLCLLTRYLIELPAMSLRKYVLSKSRD